MAWPNPITTGDEYLALILRELETQRLVLADIRDRLPTPQDEQPDPATTPIRLTEPAPTPTGAGSVADLAEPAPQRRRPPPTTAARRPSSKEKTRHGTDR
jgi:hypothetical protein